MNDSKKILIIEDDENDQMLLTQAFSNYSVNLSFKDSCLKALNAIGIGKYDFTLVDFRLGIIDSHPIIDKLNNLGYNFAILSGSMEEEIRDELNDLEKKIIFWEKKDILQIPERVMSLIK